MLGIATTTELSVLLQALPICIMVALDWNSDYYFTSQKSKSRNKKMKMKMKMNRCRDGMPKSKGSEGKYTEPHSYINTLLWKNVRMDDALYVYLQFLPSLVVYFLACHLCISSFLVITSLHFFWPIIPIKFFFFSIAYYFPQNTEIHGRRCTSINCKGGAAGLSVLLQHDEKMILGCT